jgi:preprotein translocase subunit YajC
MPTGIIIAIVVAIGAAFVYLLVRQNNKDEKKLEHDLNEDYPHPKDEGEKV